MPKPHTHTKRVLLTPNDSQTNSVWFVNTKHHSQTNAYCSANKKTYISNKYSMFYIYIETYFFNDKNILQVQTKIFQVQNKILQVRDKNLQVQSKILQVRNKNLQVQSKILQVRKNCHVTFGTIFPRPRQIFSQIYPRGFSHKCSWATSSSRTVDGAKIGDQFRASLSGETLMWNACLPLPMGKWAVNRCVSVLLYL